MRTVVLSLFFISVLSCSTSTVDRKPASSFSLISSCRSWLKSFAIPQPQSSFRKFGVEFEGVISKENNPYKRVAKNIQSTYENEGESYLLEKKKNVFGVTSEYELTGKGLTPIQVKYDESLSFNDSLQDDLKGMMGIEIASPVISIDSQKSTYLKIFKGLRDLGIKDFPNLGGIHVHVSAKNYTVSDYKDLLDFYLRSHRRVVDYFKPRKSRMNQSSYITKMVRDGLNNYDSDKLLSEAVTSSEAYKIKKNAIFYNRSLETIEFTLFNSSLDELYLEDAITFSTQIVERIKEKDRDVYNWLSGEEGLDELLNLLRKKQNYEAP